MMIDNGFIDAKTEEPSEGIIVYEEPQVVDLSVWTEHHLDVDAIYSEEDGKPVIYAFSKNRQFNNKLRIYMKANYVGKFILKGVSSDALNSFFL